MSDLTQMSDADLMSALNSAPDVGGMVQSEAQRQGVDPALALAVARRESSLRPDAVSPKGAIGPMQLMPQTARGLGVDPTDPAQNIRGGVAYLKQQLDRFGDPRLALAAYNAGPGAVQRAGGVPNIPETQAYVKAIVPDAGVSQMSDADLLAALGQQATPQATTPAAPQSAPADAPAQIPQVVDAETGKPYATAAVQHGLQQLIASGDLDPNAKPGSKAFPRGWKPGFQAGPGEWFVGPDGKLTQQPGGGPGDVAADMAKSVVAGADRAGTSLLDTALQTGPLSFVGTALGNAENIASGKAPNILPFGLASRFLDPTFYQPKTTPGRYAQSVGEMLPNAVTPGGLLRKAAAVVLPGLASEGASDVAHSLGAGPNAVAAARALGGAAAGMAAGVTVTPPQLAAEPMSVEQLKQAKRAAYQAAEASGAVIPKPAAKTMLDSISALVADKGGADLYPTAANMVNRLKSLVRGGITPTQLDDYRSQIYEQLMADGGKEANIGRQIRAHIDSVLDSDPSWADARELNARYMKAKEVSDRLDSAGLRASSTYSGGNYTNAVRQQIRPLVDPKSAQRIGNLTPDEQAAARQVVNGTFTQNRLRDMSKLMNNRFVQTGLMLVTPHGVGMPLAQAAGGALRAASDSRSELAVQRLLDLISTGGKGAAGPTLSYSASGLEPFNAGTLLQALTKPTQPQPQPGQKPAGR